LHLVFASLGHDGCKGFGGYTTTKPLRKRFGKSFVYVIGIEVK